MNLHRCNYRQNHQLELIDPDVWLAEDVAASVRRGLVQWRVHGPDLIFVTMPGRNLVLAAAAASAVVVGLTEIAHNFRPGALQRFRANEEASADHVVMEMAWLEPHLPDRPCRGRPVGTARQGYPRRRRSEENAAAGLGAVG